MNPIKDLLASKNKSVFEVPDFRTAERIELEKAYARLFGTDDGKLVLSHMQALAFMRAYGAESSDAQIRYAEGQRALVAQIMRFINAGRGN